MQDPRQTPAEPRFVVGDAALFILTENYGIEFAYVLPPDVMANWDRQGVYAYFDYVQVKKNRAKVVARLRALIERVERGAGVNPPAMKLKLEFGRSGAPLAVKIDVTNQNARSICLPHNFDARTRLAAIRNGKRLEQFNSIEGRPIRGCTTLASQQTMSFTHDLVVMYPNDRLANTSICFTLHWMPGVTERSPLRLKSSCVKSPRVSQSPETRTWRAAIETYVREKRRWPRNAYRIEFIERRRNVLTFYVIPLDGEKCLMCPDKPDAFVVEVDPAKRKVVAELALQ
jgi:hypothetical protein